MDTDFLRFLEQAAVMPVVSLPDDRLAVPLVDALAAGGLMAVEITFRTDAAVRAIERIASERPEIAVGAGTVLTAETVRRASNAGARFVVSPGFSSSVDEACLAAGLPYLPGAVTATEIMTCLEHDRRIVKFFPAKSLGGVGTVKSLAAPFASVGVRFVPTGGIGADDVAAYLVEAAVACIGGSWMVTERLLSAEDWPAVTELSKAAAQAARSRLGGATR